MSCSKQDRSEHVKVLFQKQFFELFESYQIAIEDNEFAVEKRDHVKLRRGGVGG